MAQILDELVLALDIDDKQFQAGEHAVVAGLDRLTAVMARVVETFDNGEKKNREALDKTGKQADKTAKGMEVAGKKASSFFSSIRSQVLALAGVTLSLHGLKNFVTGFTQHLNQLATAADAFGMSAKSLDGWTKAGEAFGVSANEIVGAFSRINDAKARLQAGLGLDPHLQSLLLAANQAGVNVDLSRDSTQDIMRKLTAAFPHLNTAQQQAYGGELGLGYAAQQWMGSGHALQDVERFTAGSGVDEDAIAAAKRFREQWSAISQAFEKTGYILFTALLPYLKQFNDWLNELAAWMAAHPEDIKNAVRGFLDTLKGLITLANDAAGAMGGWKNVILILIGLKFAGWLWGVYRAVAAMLGLGGGAATGAAGAGIATALTRIAPWAALVIPTNNTPSTGEEMQELERLKRENWSKNNPGVPYRAVPRGIRNNNPGNLNYARQVGATKEPGEQGRFAVFSTMQAGIAALYRQLQRYLGRGINTIAAIVQKYAPSADGNNVNAYIQALTRKLGVDANARLDPGNIQQMITLMEGIIGHENGAGYLTRADIAQALPQPGAGMAAQSRQPVAGAQSTVNETIHIGTLNATTTANNLKGVTDDARAKINRSSLVTHYASGVST